MLFGIASLFGVPIFLRASVPEYTVKESLGHTVRFPCRSEADEQSRARKGNVIEARFWLSAAAAGTETCQGEQLLLT